VWRGDVREEEEKRSVKRRNDRSRKKVPENKGMNLCGVLRYAQFCFYPYVLWNTVSGTSCLLRARGRGIAVRK